MEVSSSPFITIPPGHYAVVRCEGQDEIRRNDDSFPLFPGEQLISISKLEELDGEEESNFDPIPPSLPTEIPDVEGQRSVSLSFVAEGKDTILDLDEKKKTDLLEELEDQKNITTISMILEAGLESSFQFFFQGLFSLPTLVFSFKDVYNGEMNMSDLVNWKIISIAMSFLSFAFTSYNIR